MKEKGKNMAKKKKALPASLKDFLEENLTDKPRPAMYRIYDIIEGLTRDSFSKGTDIPTFSDILREVDRCPRVVRQHIADLVEKNLLSRKVRKDGRVVYIPSSLLGDEVPNG